MNRSDELAYPVDVYEYSDGGKQTLIAHYYGMTIRERMAMAAMQGLLADKAAGSYETVAYLAVRFADALLTALEDEQ